MRTPPKPNPRFAQLFQKNWGSVVSRCRRLLGDKMAAEDAAQETFFKIIDHLENLPPEAAEAWLNKAATNNCLNRLRNNGTTQKVLTGLAQHRLDDFENRMLSQQLVRQTIKEVPKKLRSAAILYFLMGVDQGQIAKTLNKSRRTIVSRLAEFVEHAQEVKSRKPETKARHEPLGLVRPRRARRALRGVMEELEWLQSGEFEMGQESWPYHVAAVTAQNQNQNQSEGDAFVRTPKDSKNGTKPP